MVIDKIGSFDRFTASVVEDNFYVHDGLISMDTAEAAIELVDQLRHLLSWWASLSAMSQ